MPAIVKSKNHKYEFDRNNKPVIVTPNPICAYCFTEIPPGEKAYLADYDKILICRDCLVVEYYKGYTMVPPSSDRRNTVYLAGRIIIKGDS